MGKFGPWKSIKFWFLGCKVGDNYILHVSYLRNSLAYGHNLWYTCVKWWYLQAFSSFSQNFNFLGCQWGNMAKNDPKWQKILSVISQKSYIMSFMVHLCKMMISSGIFFISFKFRFFRLLGGKRAKYGTKWKITITFATRHISGTVQHMIMIFGTLV